MMDRQTFMRASCSPNRYATLLPSHIEPAPPGEYERTVPAEPHRHRRQAVGDGEVGEETAVDGAAVVAHRGCRAELAAVDGTAVVAHRGCRAELAAVDGTAVVAHRGCKAELA